MKSQIVTMPNGKQAVEIEGLWFRPKASFQDGQTPFGCFSSVIQYIQMRTEPVLLAKDGSEACRASPNGFSIDWVPLTDKQRKVIDVLHITPMHPDYAIALSAELSSDIARDLMKVGMDAVWDTFLDTYRGRGIVLWGDALGKHGYFTKYLGWYITQKGEGTLSSTHGAINPTYPSSPKVCRVWAWSPPYSSVATVPPNETYGVKPRSEKELIANIRKKWKSQATSLKYDPVLLNLAPEDGELLAEKVV